MFKNQKLFITQISSFICERYPIRVDVADLIACQAALESAFGESRLAKESFNFFGMKQPIHRITSSVGVDGDFAVYKSTGWCVHDYFLWLQYQRFNQSDLRNPHLFLAKLKSSGYCPDKDYIKRITNLFNSYKNG